MPRHAKVARVAKVFGPLLRVRRKALDLTQEEFAHRTGLDVSFVSRVERGLTQPSIGVLIQMAKTLGTSSALLMAEVEKTLGSR
jgi:transcriptional regulator with XRE-family HTH domain